MRKRLEIITSGTIRRNIGLNRCGRKKMIGKPLACGGGVLVGRESVRVTLRAVRTL